MVKILKIDPSSPAKEVVEELAAAILASKLVVIPTDTRDVIATNSLQDLYG